MPSGKQFFDELIEHWKAMPKSTGPVPSKTAFSPMQVYTMLHSLYFSERLDKYNIQLKLRGEKLERFSFGAVPRRNVYEVIPKRNWDAVENYYDQFCSQPCAGHMIRLVTFDNGLVYNVETMELPLADRDGNPRYIVGLAELTQNHAKSLEAQQSGVKLDEVTLYECWDLGYGVPKS